MLFFYANVKHMKDIVLLLLRMVRVSV